MIELVNHIKKNIEEYRYGKKVLVFSFFADTIHYLKQNLKTLMSEAIPDFDKQSEFLTGQSSKTEDIVGRFSPISKKYCLDLVDGELNFLFATDVLSEGQNLQDSGHLINYDLHWNPVRMIQRNGRINRIGSVYDEVLIANMKPNSDLELYLNLVHRLEGKINTIKNTVGLDQSVLHNSDVNPIDFIEKYYNTGELPDLEDDYLAHTDTYINDLRVFLGRNDKESVDYLRVSSISKGKWNYLPESTDFRKSFISLVKIKGNTVSSKKEFKDMFFVEIEEDKDEFKAYYIDQTKALEYIKAIPEDNKRALDSIKTNRKRISSRVLAEAKRQAKNPDAYYQLKPSKLKALSYVVDYLVDTAKIDYKGIIEKGVNKTNVRDELEKILNKVSSEMKTVGSLQISTIIQFKDIFSEIYVSQSEEKEVNESDLILVYAKK